MIQILLHNLKMDPLVSLHYYAPVCAIINLLIIPFTEGLEPFYQLKDLGGAVLVSNAAVAFLLNVAAVFLVGVASSLVLTLSGVFKVSWLISSFVFGFVLAPCFILSCYCSRSWCDHQWICFITRPFRFPICGLGTTCKRWIMHHYSAFSQFPLVRTCGSHPFFLFPPFSLRIGKLSY